MSNTSLEVNTGNSQELLESGRAERTIGGMVSSLINNAKKYMPCFFTEQDSRDKQEQEKDKIYLSQFLSKQPKKEISPQKTSPESKAKYKPTSTFTEEELQDYKKGLTNI